MHRRRLRSRILAGLPALLLLATACGEPTPEELLADATEVYTAAKVKADKIRAELEVREEALAKAQAITNEEMEAAGYK